MKTRTSLSEDDTRSVVGLLSCATESPGDIEEKKQVLMKKFCSLIDADSCAWELARRMEPGKPNLHLSLSHGGFTNETYPVFIQAYSHPEMTRVQEPFAKDLAERKYHFTRRHLKISLHTASDYVKSVFAYFEVHSQAAPIAHFRNGDGGHR